MESEQSVVVVYKVVNDTGDEGRYNAFEMPRESGITLASIKKYHVPPSRLNHPGSEYYWRVRVDARPSSSRASSISEKGLKLNSYIWRDIKNEKAVLPLKEVSSSELSCMLNRPMSEGNSVASRTKPNIIVKARNAVSAPSAETQNKNAKRARVIILKAVDIGKVRESFFSNSKENPYRKHRDKFVTSSAVDESFERKIMFQPANIIESQNRIKDKQIINKLLHEQLDKKIKEWSHENERMKNLQRLLSTLQEILWDDSDWKVVSLDYLSDPNKCINCYRKACRLTFRDKALNENEEVVYTARQIFGILHHAKKNFDSKETG